MIKETGWYTGDQKPVRVGVYKRETTPESIYYSFWKGESWGFLALTKEQANFHADSFSEYQTLSWCGLTEESIV